MMKFSDDPKWDNFANWLFRRVKRDEQKHETDQVQAGECEIREDGGRVMTISAPKAKPADKPLWRPLPKPKTEEENARRLRELEQFYGLTMGPAEEPTENVMAGKRAELERLYGIRGR